MLKRFHLAGLWAGLLLIVMSGCQEGPVVRQFECQTSEECSSTRSCQEGKCVEDDKDGDGFASRLDCNDNNKNVRPGTSEICENQIDDNCDGNVDEMPCNCLEGTERKCGVEDVGTCRQGIQRCERGKFGACLGEVGPQDEDCDNQDNDCDGKTDEALEGDCYSGPDGTRDRGNCKAGKRTCTNGQWSACEGEVKPGAETCNAQDDDCDGLVDQGLEEKCYEGPDGTQGIGVCQAGKKACVAGQWTECKGAVAPGTEDCNGQDDDCDGMIDQGLGGPCYLGPMGTEGVGECKGGMRTCDGGQFTACIGQVLPESGDACNDGKDNDCDGAADEGCQVAFEIRTSINTDDGKIDGIVSPGWQGNGKFQLQSLRIPANARVKVTGSNPLTLTVQGDVEIVGTLDLSAENGESSNCQGNNIKQGGAAGGGGGKGGDSGNCSISGAQPNGGDGIGAGGGKGGQGNPSTGGGGGGGGHANKGGDGLPMTPGGAGGAQVGSATTLTGGSGGGGGACGTLAGEFTYTPGAGAGGGGGAVQIESTVGNINVTGNILTRGGDGGLGATCSSLFGNSVTGGSGGGGSGGMIWLRAKGDITIAATAFMDAKGGKGPGTGAKGGDGSEGRIRFQDQDGMVNFPVARVEPTPALATY